MNEWTRRMLAEQNHLSSVQLELERMKKFGMYDDLDRYSSYGQLSAARQVALEQGQKAAKAPQQGSRTSQPYA